MADLSASFQHVAFAHLENRLVRALEYVRTEGIPVTGLVVAGGVAANLELRRLARRSQIFETLSNWFCSWF